MVDSILSAQEHLISCKSLRTIDLSNKYYPGELGSLELGEMFFKHFFIHLQEKIDKEASHQLSLAKKKVLDFSDVSRVILEILLARKYRSGKREEVNPDAVYNRIARFVQQGRPIELYISMFPCKIPNPLKTAGAMPDLAEVIAIARLIEICTAVEKVYQPGARFTILPDGKRFLDIANFPLKRIMDYQMQLIKLVHDLGGVEKIVCLDYADLLEMLPKNDKKKIDLLKRKYYTEYSTRFGLLSDQTLHESVVTHIREKETILRLDELSKKFFALFHSLLYTIYHPEIMENEDNIRDTLALRVFQNIFSPSDDKRVHAIRQKILIRTWNAAIGYITNISVIRETSPAEKVMPDGIRFDMHNIPGRIGLYTVYRSTKYTPFHTSGFIDQNCEMKIDFRVNLENENFVRVSGNSYSELFGTQPFMYVHRSLVTFIKKDLDAFIQLLAFRP